jgi:uncharacterized protein (TIGR03083 family)
MFDLTTATKSTERDFTAILSRFEQLADGDWERPVRCVGWTVADLAQHLVEASHGQAEGLRRAADGRTELAALDGPPTDSIEGRLEALRSGREQLLTALQELPDAALAGVIPLPFGLLPAPVALQIVPLEYGFHRNDLEWALGNEEQLNDDIAGALLGLAPNLLPILAGGTPVSDPGEAPQRPMAYRLEAPATTFTVAFDGAVWTAGDESARSAGTCGISGDDSALALFIMGRLPAGHSSLQTNDLATAARFKHYFPGP